MISKEKADFIRSLADANGNIEPDDVIAASRPEDSPTHDDFEWDVDAAAQQHWRQQADRLIRSVKLQVIIEKREITSVCYVKDPQRDPKSRRFVELTVAAQSRATSAMILAAEMERVTQAVRRASQIASVLGLTDELDELLAAVTRLKVMADSPPIRTATTKRRSQKKAAIGKRRRSSAAEARV